MRRLLVFAVVLLVGCGTTRLDGASSTPPTGVPGSGPSASKTTSTITPTTSPSTTTPEPGRLAPEIADLVAFVEATRGHTFSEVPPIVFLDEEEFVSSFETFDEVHIQFVAFWQAIGFLEPDADISSLFEGFTGDILGFYDIESSTMTIRGGPLSPLAQVTVVHELTHALDDDHFDIGRGSIMDDDASFGFDALVEGIAEWVAAEYQNELDGARASRLYRELGDLTAEADEDVDLIGVASALRYVFGLELVERLVEIGGLDLVDQAFDAPPTTSEQVFDPEKYLKGEPAKEVPAPSPDGYEIGRGPLGMVDVLLFLWVDGFSAEAWKAAEGWGGGEWVTWASGDSFCIRGHVAFDTKTDHLEARDAFETWSNNRESGTLSDHGEYLELVSCR